MGGRHIGDICEQESLHSTLFLDNISKMGCRVAFLFLLLVPTIAAFQQTPRSQPFARHGNTLQAPRILSLRAKDEISTTKLMARRWNFNEGRGPFGLKNNAEIWNGRAAQVGFTIVMLQELVTGKGVIAELQAGNVVNWVILGSTAFAMIGLTVFLAIKGEEEDDININNN